MFVPVVFRFRRYGVAVPVHLQEYVEKVLAFAPVQEWVKLATQED
jgi:glutathione S-transferase